MSDEHVSLKAESSVMPDEEQLHAQLQHAEQKLGSLEKTLRAVEDEFEALAEEHQRYESVEQACRSFERLVTDGTARFFWGEFATDEAVADHLTDVRARIAESAGQLIAVQERRQVALGNVSAQQEAVDYIEEDLYQEIQAEQRRRSAWIVEREETVLPQRAQIMPWTRRLEEDDRFRKSLGASVLASLLLGLLIPFIDLPIPSRDDLIEVPERLVRFIQKEPQRPVPPPQPVREQRRDEELPEQKSEPDPQVEPEVAPETQLAEVAAPEAELESARERLASTGLLAFRENFANIARASPSVQLGADARIGNSGDSATGSPTRAMVATRGPGSSGGINLAALSRDVGVGGGGGGIEGVALTRVASSIGASGTSDRPLSAGAVAGRTDEEIQIVFDRYKAALYRLYNRELRKDPTLQGLMILRLTIEPDGSVSLCQLQSSDMDAPMLADQVVNRVTGFDFGAKDVPVVTILFPIDFLPTA